jgi:ATP-binding cassette subfamily C protein
VTITQRAALLMSVDKIMIMHQGAVQAFGSRDEIIPMLTGGKPNKSVPKGPDDPPSLN